MRCAPRSPASPRGPCRRRPTRGGTATADGLAALICARKWRRSRVDADTADDIRAKVAAALAAGAPIGFAVPFGGYKGPQQPSAPHVDWAELFWIAHLRAYGESLAAVHAPGVVFSLSYFHGVLGAINRLPRADQDRYIEGLGAVLAHYSDRRVRFELVDLSPLFGGPAGVVAAIERRFDDLKNDPGANPPAPVLRSAARNLIGSGAEASERDIRASALRCLAMESLEARRRFNKFGPRIQITHIRGASLSLHLGSCATSIMQPWVGTGVLEGDGAGGWRPRILNGRVTVPEARQAVTHPLEGLSPALRTIGLLRAAATA